MDNNNQYNQNSNNPNSYIPQQQPQQQPQQYQHQQQQYQQQPYYNPYVANRPPYDPNSEPMTIKDWIFTFLLMMIPIANIVLLFVWAFGTDVNKSKKTYCQASLIMALIGICLYILFFVLILGFIASLTIY